MLHHPSLTLLKLARRLGSDQMGHLLSTCAQAAARPQGTLTVQLLYVDAAAVRQQWAQAQQVAAHDHVAIPPASRVVVTDRTGTDLLAAQ